MITADQVARITGCPDPVLRNLWITQSYHDLGLAVAHRLGRRNVSWSGFGTWASKTAGRFIRGEWLPDSMRAWLMSVGRCAAWIEEMDVRVQEHIAAGNLKVYADLGPLFVELLRLLEVPGPEREVALARSLERMRTGPVERGGQDALAQALRAFVVAASQPEGPARAQWILLGNLVVGAHEQYRLQDQIAGALDAAWELLPTPRRSWTRELMQRVATHLRQRMTFFMVRLGLPELELAVGRDVPALPSGSMFPTDLQTITLPELRAVLARFDRTPNTTTGSAAADWADYGDRMNFLVDMFRSRQQIPSLWRTPFDPRQTAAIRAGFVPAGSL